MLQVVLLLVGKTLFDCLTKANFSSGFGAMTSSVGSSSSGLSSKKGLAPPSLSDDDEEEEFDSRTLFFLCGFFRCWPLTGGCFWCWTTSQAVLSLFFLMFFKMLVNFNMFVLDWNWDMNSKRSPLPDAFGWFVSSRPPSSHASSSFRISCRPSFSRTIWTEIF